MLPNLRRLGPLVWAFVLGMGLVACSGQEQQPKQSSPSSSQAPVVTTALKLQSPAFAPGETIPEPYSCQGDNISPPLTWTAGPAATRSWALIVEDPDAPGRVWQHWLIYNLPAESRSLAENQPFTAKLDNGAQQSQNTSGSIGYTGPCPPKGAAHHYHFQLYALDTKLQLVADAGRQALDPAMQGHILAQAELVGLYRR